jgi:hypothetical protein
MVIHVGVTKSFAGVFPLRKDLPTTAKNLQIKRSNIHQRQPDIYKDLHKHLIRSILSLRYTNDHPLYVWETDRNSYPGIFPGFRYSADGKLTHAIY